MDINKEFLKGLSDETKQKMRACETPEDFMALAEEEGVELTDDQLEAVAGGGFHCGSFNGWECTSGYWTT